MAEAEAAAAIVVLRAALKPIADFADPSGRAPDSLVITGGSGLAKRQLTMGDCYRAARALQETSTLSKEA